MSKVSSIGNSLAYLLCQRNQRANDYRPGMTPEDVRVVFEKSLRGDRKKRAAMLRKSDGCNVEKCPRQGAKGETKQSLTVKEE